MKIISRPLLILAVTFAPFVAAAQPVGPGPTVPYSGTWSPAFAFGGSCTNCTYTLQSGSWLRIGNWVIFDGQAVLSSKGAGASTGTVTVTLPCTPAAVNARASLSVRMNSLTGAINGSFNAVTVEGATTITPTVLTAGTQLSIDNTAVNDNSSVAIGGAYPVASCP